MWTGTCLSAYLPPITAAARMGSVGVRQAATARLERKVRPGTRANMRAADTNHPFYFFGNVLAIIYWYSMIGERESED